MLDGPDSSSLLAPLLRRLTAAVVRSPLSVVVIAMLLAVASALVTARGLDFKTSRLDLLNPHSEYNQRWLDYLAEFGRDDDALVIVEGSDPEAVRSAIDALARALRADPGRFRSVLCEIDLTRLRAKGMHFLPLEELQQLEQHVRRWETLTVGRWRQATAREQLRALTTQLTAKPTALASYRPSAAAAEAERWARSLEAALADSPRYESPWPARSADRWPASKRFTANDGRTAFLLTKLQSEDGLARDSGAVAALRQRIAEVQARHPAVVIGLTGLPVMENDEMRSSSRDMLTASVVSLIAVTLLFMAGFGSLVYPLLTVAALLVALVWSFAFITLSVGHLNILSVAFGAILIGLGIDFGVHYVACYLQVRPLADDAAEALQTTSQRVGPGVVTGGVTTALAFCTAALTEFTGIAELGWIAGGGIVLCVIAALTVLPALIYLADRRPTRSTPPEPLPFSRVCEPGRRWPLGILTLSVVIALLLGSGAARLRYDHNLLNLQPVRLDSVRWERALLARSQQSVWYAVSVCGSREELLRRQSAFGGLPAVERTEQIVSLLPAPSAAQIERIERIQKRLIDLPELPPVVPLDSAEAAQELAERCVQLAGALPSAHSPTARRLRKVGVRLTSLPPQQSSQRIYQHQQRTAADILAQLRQLKMHGRPEPPQLKDLASELRERYVGRTQKHLLKIYARGDIWDMHALKRFVRQLESVDPRVTGHPVQTFYASRQMQQSYIHAAIYALLAVAIVLMLDFRSIRCTLLAMAPMGLGMLMMFGLLGLLDIPLNPANMIVLPLILGIGIDDGVHVVHDYRRQSGRYRLSHATATAIIVTSATTMVGFGSLMLAQHQGLRSLGQVLTLGVFCCMAASLFTLPALLSLLPRKRSGGEGVDFHAGQAVD